MQPVCRSRIFHLVATTRDEGQSWEVSTSEHDGFSLTDPIINLDEYWVGVMESHWLRRLFSVELGPEEIRLSPHLD
jgi:hypothetical protein